MTGTPGVLFRPATPEDLAALSALARSVRTERGEPPAWIEHCRPVLTFTAGDLARSWFQVAESSDGELVGFCACAEGLPRWIVEHLWVRPSHQRRGIGSTLVREALDAAGRRSARGLEIDADPSAEAFYLRLGARRVGNVPAPMPGEPWRMLPQLQLDARST